MASGGGDTWRPKRRFTILRALAGEMLTRVSPVSKVHLCQLALNRKPSPTIASHVKLAISVVPVADVRTPVAIPEAASNCRGPWKGVPSALVKRPTPAFMMRSTRPVKTSSDVACIRRRAGPECSSEVRKPARCANRCYAVSLR
jgi:hypothetical protein